ncbi:secondary thiamine-phosphate synthase enzyme YjbQ [Flavobacteriales bacterium]|nr:secondary thiamine-phosphate synthase enzyme YjbQ [Flavobacteriales bacterium]
MIQQLDFFLTAKSRGFHLITKEVMFHLPEFPEQGILNLFIKHTSAALTINENYDPTVRMDFESSMNHLVKENEPFYKHTLEGADDMPAHIKSSIMGFTLSIPITDAELNLGTWQGIYLCEFRNHMAKRKLIATIYS